MKFDDCGDPVVLLGKTTGSPYIVLVHTVVETPSFLTAAEIAGVSDDEREAMISVIASDPMAGDEIPGSGGYRKIRFAGKGRGKSGG